jgi:hypothetical protein
MTSTPERRILYVVVCGAGPAADVGKLLAAAQVAGWDTYVIATPAGLSFLDVGAVSAQSGHPVRSEYRTPTEPRQSLPPADAIIVAPATYNTINKLAAGINDNYALGVLTEAIGALVPVIMLPFINTALAGRAPLKAAVAALRGEAVRVLLGNEAFQPHPPGDGGGRIGDFPWTVALREAESIQAAGPR